MKHLFILLSVFLSSLVVAAEHENNFEYNYAEFGFIDTDFDSRSFRGYKFKVNYDFDDHIGLTYSKSEQDGSSVDADFQTLGFNFHTPNGDKYDWLIGLGGVNYDVGSSSSDGIYFDLGIRNDINSNWEYTTKVAAIWFSDRGFDNRYSWLFETVYQLNDDVGLGLSADFANDDSDEFGVFIRVNY